MPSMPVVPLRLGTFISVLALAPIWVGNTSFWIERNGGQPASLRFQLNSVERVVKDVYRCWSSGG